MAVIFNNDVVRNTESALLSATSCATAHLSDMRDRDYAGASLVLVRVFGELCLVGLFVASLVEGVVRMGFAFAFIPVALFICDFDNHLSWWFAQTSVIALANACYIASDALVQNVFAQKLDLYRMEFTPAERQLMSRYRVNQEEMQSQEVLIIPEAKSSKEGVLKKDVQKHWNAWVKELNETFHLLDGINDDGNTLAVAEATTRWNNNFPRYLTGTTPYDETYANIMHHLAIFIKDGWDKSMAQLCEGEKSVLKSYLADPRASRNMLNQRQVEASIVLKNAARMVRTIIISYGHCPNRRGTTVESLYRDFCVNDPKLLEKETIGHRARIVLAEMRDRIFVNAVLKIIQGIGGDQASAENSVRRRDGARWGVAAGISQHDNAHLVAGDRVRTEDMDAAFTEHYTVPKIVALLRDRLKDQSERTFPSGRFLAWIPANRRDVSVDAQGNFTLGTIVDFLATEGIIERQ